MRPIGLPHQNGSCDGLILGAGCRSGRSVPISSQLRSHRLFSENWERLAYLVDAATLYHTGLRPLSSQAPQSVHTPLIASHTGCTPVQKPFHPLQPEPVYKCCHVCRTWRVHAQPLQMDTSNEAARVSVQLFSSGLRGG